MNLQEPSRETKKNKELKLTQRDFKILQFLWESKMATTATIWRSFFGERVDRDAAYCRLNTLKNAGYLRYQSSDSGEGGAVWTLTERGFKTRKNDLPALRERGYASENLEHDLTVMAFQLGEWLSQRPPTVELFTEQQLRRYVLEAYPIQIPHSELHRPDGYWYDPKGTDCSRSVAIEVELNQQCNSKYETLSVWYDRANIYRVFWLVRSAALGNKIYDLMRKSDPGSIDKHSFVLLSDFKKNGWQAKLQTGLENGNSVHEFLCKHFTISNQSPSMSGVSAILDTRKRPSKSKTSV